ncbi:2-C-methyl-D-erythritol 4-phosphate cytidylyltransferase [uncultured Clostridium sp.]|uniref:2-C-methyl-D-erythritol 4-phosphate cytidylyltransferase n=1 Tax=Clostridium sp. TaxID=1506 RepID=UPI0026706DE8|nr:2-C-methyl-D-erythritol 4-phosphate cytidylyltransferase [uncultured Clostridium sp.]
MISAIILAGGKGKRMRSAISKQFIDIKGKPIIYYTLKKFSENKKIDNIIVVLPEDEVKYFKENILKKYELRINKIVIGGKERQDSVYNSLKSLKNSSTDIVLIHDGARPFISERIINEGIKFAEIYGAAAPGVMPKDTIKVKNEKNFSVDTPNRANLVSIQTPQVFKFDEILECHEKIRYNGEKVTDDTMVVEKYGYSVYLYDGEYTNIKVTTPEDLILAERLI